MSELITPGRIVTVLVLPLVTAGALLIVAAIEQAAFAYRLWRNVHTHHPLGG